MNEPVAAVRPIIKSWVAWLSALWTGVAIHLDWHLGRPGHIEHRSFDFQFHWIAGIVVFAHLAWLINRRWPDRFREASVFIIVAGVVAGQFVEPFAEVMDLQWDWTPLTSAVWWHIFIEFMAAGILSHVIVARLLPRRNQKLLIAL
jgi:hypothetical protein